MQIKTTIRSTRAKMLTGSAYLGTYDAFVRADITCMHDRITGLQFASPCDTCSIVHASMPGTQLDPTIRTVHIKSKLSRFNIVPCELRRAAGLGSTQGLIEDCARA